MCHTYWHFPINFFLFNMKTCNTKNTLWATYLISALIVLFVIDGFIQPGYWLKSLFKLGLFALIPIFGLWRERRLPRTLLSLDKSSKIIMILGLGLIILIILGYFILLNLTTFSNIPQILSEQAAVNLDNFLWVSLYIVMINSFLEEFFFRYLFLNVIDNLNKNIAMILSALSFSLYHVGILFGWFDFWLFLLMVLGLFIVGILFTRMNSRPGSIANSYLVHMAANIGINIVGFIILTSTH